jgi:rhodanese-related sulfurtransferase
MERPTLNISLFGKRFQRAAGTPRFTGRARKERKEAMKTIEVKDLQAMIDREEDFDLVNVLPEKNYREEHIPGSFNIPYNDEHFEEKAKMLIPDTKQMVVVYCASTECDASPKAGKHLEEMGYSNIVDFEGGVKAWQEAGNTLVSNGQS